MSTLTTSLPLSDSSLLAQLGLSEVTAAELLSSAEKLIGQYGADTTVEAFLEQQGKVHADALKAYYDQRIHELQTDAQEQVAEIRAQFAPQ
jgi:predicted nucleic acid-binding protein